MHADGDGLYLRISAGRVVGRRWVFVYYFNRKRREMGLGSAATVTLAEARQKARDARAKLDSGEDPLGAKVKKSVPTFADLAAKHIATKGTAWRNPIHRKQWVSTLRDYCRPINDLPVNEITTEHVLACLTPIWQSKPETASRVRGRIETILDVAKVRGWRDGQNPAQWRGHLALILPARTQESRSHHDAMAIDDLPAFITELREREAVAARCLEFLILTVARTSEATDAAWGEFGGAVWTVPAQRMKAKRIHRVPLVPRALEIVDEMRPLRDGDFVFPGLRRGKPLSNMSLLRLLRRMGRAAVTTHGFRSTFRDWVSDRTSFQPDLAEMALAHTLPSKTERAYRRGDALERRGPMMQAWSDFLSDGDE